MPSMKINPLFAPRILALLWAGGVLAIVSQIFKVMIVSGNQAAHMFVPTLFVAGVMLAVVGANLIQKNTRTTTTTLHKHAGSDSI